MTKVVEKFLRYVKIDTKSSEESETCPTTESQYKFGELLVEELKSIGMKDASIDENGYVMAYLPSNVDKKVETIGFIAHMDTAPDFSGENVKPQIVENYDGGDIILNKDLNIVLSPEKSPELKNYIGETLITTDGTTLLGADDKAGVAEIMTAMEFLINNPGIKHGPIAICFTPDEEVGRGVENFELDKFPVDYAFTIDGDRIDSVDYETFNAAQAVVTFDGTSIHPGDAKDRMVNASLLAMEYASSLPKKQTPSHTQGRQGFYHLVGMEGICEDAKLTYILRNHSKQSFIAQKQKMEAIADKMNEKYGNRVHVSIRDQYENMRQYMHGDMRSVNKAKYALRQCDVTPVSTPIRGGTDGAMLTARGLICPNLGTGSFNHHGRFEFASIQKMEKMVEIVLKIVE